jgi:hypothetical protein
MRDWRSATSTILGSAEVDIADPRLRRLFSAALSRIPSSWATIETVQSVRLRSRGSRPGLVGLTTWSDESGRQSGGLVPERLAGTQKITFYTGLLTRISEEAIIGVMAHEVAHAWLNEHDHPEESKKREVEADELARRWGFGDELEALARETDPY